MRGRRAAFLILALCACGPEAPEPETREAPPAPEPVAAADGVDVEDPETARWDMVDGFVADVGAARDPSDGGGRARLVDPPAEIHVLEPHTFTIAYEVGEHGIAEGGSIWLQPSPFWGWSTPQAQAPSYRGYTTASTDADGVTLTPRTYGGGNERTDPIQFVVQGRALEPGETVTIVYGEGGGAYVDRYAESDARLWLSVDGDGDDVRGVVEDSPGVTILPGPAALLVVTLPSVARPGESIRATLAVLDAGGNMGVPFEGDVALQVPEGIELPESVSFVAADRGAKTVAGVAREVGIHRVAATTPYGFTDESNPLVVSASRPKVLWADLHGHSNLSDGTATPEEFFTYARDVAALDVVALTDHDHWGMLFLDEHPELWEGIQAQVDAFHEPGRFVTVLAYEWTSWIHGHRHVLYFDNEGEVLSSVDPDYTTPRQLWDALAGREALTFAHHSAGGPIATNWTYRPPPELEPVTEIMSVHGSSEAIDSPRLIYSPLEGNFVRDVLDDGLRFGFVGSGDSHDGHPGLPHVASPHGGLAALITDDLSREGVLATLRARRCYATSGARILLRTELGDAGMGETVPPSAETGPRELLVAVVAEGELDRVELIRSGEVVGAVDGEGRRQAALALPFDDLEAGEYLYVRAIQRDRHLAWSSPIYVGDGEE